MKKLFLITITLFGSFFLKPCFAQSWSAMDSGLYGNSGPNYVTTILEYDSTIYAGSDCMFAGSGSMFVDFIAQWNGGLWDSVSQGLRYYVLALNIYNGNLIAGGNFQYGNADSTYGYLSQWNGVSWSKLGPDTSFFAKRNPYYTDGVFALTMYNGNLIASGIFDSVPGTNAGNIAYWNGLNWSTFAAGLTGISTNTNPINVGALVVYNGNLYAAGHFDSAGGILARNIATWNGSSWSPVGSGIDSSVSALAVYNGNLYASGQFDSAGDNRVYGIAMWNGASWSPVGGKLSTPGGIYALTSYNGYLYAGGGFDTIGGIAANDIAYWDGSSWNSIGTGVKPGRYNDERDIYTIYGYNNDLYIGGTFDTAGGVPAQNIAMCSVSTGINEVKNSSNFNIFPNPNNGIFTIALSHPELVSGSQTICEIYNVLGEKVYYAMLKQVQHDCKINISSQPNGVYFYRVLDGNRTLLGSGKVIIDK